MLMWTNRKHKKNWVERVRNSLRSFGYYYEPGFCSDTTGTEPVVSAAKLLGVLYVPAGTSSTRPIIHTAPTRCAPLWRPFDRGAPIRWHNDFSTRTGRPVLSLSWIQQEDPGGSDKGAWQVASTEAILEKLCQVREGRILSAELSERAEPFGYRDAGSWRLFRVVVRRGRRLDQRALRFYGRALEEGAWLQLGKVPERTHEIIGRIEEAADAVREVLHAKSGALLIVHNNYSLHYRTTQTVIGTAQNRRHALLCFVKQLHQPL